ncbi:hypothetical protein ABG067_001715 [Albugo candida]
MAMVRYASALSGIYPMEAPHVLKVESILGCYDELGMHIVQILHFIPDEAAKAAKTKELVEHTCPKVLGYVQNLISGKFVLDGKFSIADVAIFSIVDHYLFAMKGFNVSKYPKILSVVENVKAEPNIAAYLSKKLIEREYNIMEDCLRTMTDTLLIRDGSAYDRHDHTNWDTRKS